MSLRHSSGLAREEKPPGCPPVACVRKHLNHCLLLPARAPPMRRRAPVLIHALAARQVLQGEKEAQCTGETSLSTQLCKHCKGQFLFLS